MNILQVVQHLKTGGLEKVVVDLVKNSRFTARTYILSLEGTKQDALRAFPQLAPVSDRVICLNKPAGWQLSASSVIAKVCQQYSINLIHSHHIGPLLYTAIAQLKAPRFKHLHTIHDAWFLNTKRYRLMFKAIAAMTNTYFIADANTVLQDVKQLTGIAANQTILNGINTQRFKPGKQCTARQQLNLPNDVFLIGCAARLEQGKGHRDMLRALQKLPRNMAMVFAGDGSLKEALQNLCDDLGVSERVFWLGNCHDMPLFYQAIDSFCLFSSREGLPLTLLEAIASRKPVVTTNVGGIPEVITQETGILLSPRNSRALPSALLKSLQWRPSQGHTMRLRQKIDVRTMCDQYDDLFEQFSN